MKPTSDKLPQSGRKGRGRPPGAKNKNKNKILVPDNSVPSQKQITTVYKQAKRGRPKGAKNKNGTQNEMQKKLIDNEESSDSNSRSLFSNNCVSSSRDSSPEGSLKGEKN
jgi:hypothetical protein